PNITRLQISYNCGSNSRKKTLMQQRVLLRQVASLSEKMAISQLLNQLQNARYIADTPTGSLTENGTFKLNRRYGS
ncbi:MAG: hypothetical protein L6406_25375, partial [Desulfobacterales bacterium]|nr:hypothetical protein [Desulfobacterales bacterium]